MAAEEVLASYQARVGGAHPHALICSLNIATALCLEDDYGAAQAHVRRAVGGLESRLGPDHPYTLTAKLMQASVLARTDALADAEMLEEQVAARRTRVLGPRHPDTLRCRANLLLTQAERGNRSATADRQQVIGELRMMLGAEHPDVRGADRQRRLLCVIDPQPF